MLRFLQDRRMCTSCPDDDPRRSEAGAMDRRRWRERPRGLRVLKGVGARAAGALSPHPHPPPPRPSPDLSTACQQSAREFRPRFRGRARPARRKSRRRKGLRFPTIPWSAWDVDFVGECRMKSVTSVGRPRPGLHDQGRLGSVAAPRPDRRECRADGAAGNPGRSSDHELASCRCARGGMGKMAERRSGGRAG